MKAACLPATTLLTRRVDQPDARGIREFPKPVLGRLPSQPGLPVSTAGTAARYRLLGHAAPLVRALRAIRMRAAVLPHS